MSYQWRGWSLLQRSGQTPSCAPREIEFIAPPSHRCWLEPKRKPWNPPRIFTTRESPFGSSIDLPKAIDPRRGAQGDLQNVLLLSLKQYPPINYWSPARAARSVYKSSTCVNFTSFVCLPPLVLRLPRVVVQFDCSSCLSLFSIFSPLLAFCFSTKAATVTCFSIYAHKRDEP